MGNTNEPVQKEQWLAYLSFPRIPGNPKLMISTQNPYNHREKYQFLCKAEQVSRNLLWYQNRKQHHKNVVKVHSCSWNTATSNQIQFQVVTQRVPFRLHDFLKDNDFFTLQETLHVLGEVLRGYRALWDFGITCEPNIKTIGFNNQGQVKVWINQNWADNALANSNQSEQEFVSKIIQLVFKMCHNSSQYFEQFQQKISVRSFEQIEKAIETYNVEQQLTRKQIIHRIYAKIQQSNKVNFGKKRLQSSIVEDCNNNKTERIHQKTSNQLFKKKNNDLGRRVKTSNSIDQKQEKRINKLKFQTPPKNTCSQTSVPGPQFLKSKRKVISIKDLPPLAPKNLQTQSIIKQMRERRKCKQLPDYMIHSANLYEEQEQRNKKPYNVSFSYCPCNQTTPRGQQIMLPKLNFNQTQQTKETVWTDRPGSAIISDTVSQALRLSQKNPQREHRRTNTNDLSIIAQGGIAISIARNEINKVNSEFQTDPIEIKQESRVSQSKSNGSTQRLNKVLQRIKHLDVSYSQSGSNLPYSLSSSSSAPRHIRESNRRRFSLEIQRLLCDSGEEIINTESSEQGDKQDCPKKPQEYLPEPQSDVDSFKKLLQNYQKASKKNQNFTIQEVLGERAEDYTELEGARYSGEQIRDILNFLSTKDLFLDTIEQDQENQDSRATIQKSKIL